MVAMTVLGVLVAGAAILGATILLVGGLLWEMERSGKSSYSDRQR